MEIEEIFKQIWKYHDKLGHDTPFINQEHRIRIIREGCLALYQEVAELTDSFPWKPWRKIEDQTFDKDNATREIVDILFFLAKITRASNITIEDIEAKFKWVLANNLDRIRQGYNFIPKEEESQISVWRKYDRTNVAEMRPYICGEDLSKISVSNSDNPIEDMGMIARNPNNHKDQWYVNKRYFEENFKKRR